MVEVVQKFCDVSCLCFDDVCDTDNAEQEKTRKVRAEISLADLALGRASVDCHALIHDGDALRLQQRLNVGLLEACHALFACDRSPNQAFGQLSSAQAAREARRRSAEQREKAKGEEKKQGRAVLHIMPLFQSHDAQRPSVKSTQEARS